MFYGLERYPWESAGMYILVGLTKLLVIAFTVQSGFRVSQAGSDASNVCSALHSGATHTCRLPKEALVGLLYV